MSEPFTGGNRITSVIVPCSNRLDATSECVAAFFRHTRAPWELIAVDDGSADGTATYLQGVRDAAPDRVVIISNAERRGFPAACGQILAQARGHYLVLLDNHAVVTDNWLNQLISLAESDPKIGMVGPMSNDAASPQFVDSIPYVDLDAMHRFAATWREEHRGRWFTVSKLSGFCLLMKRAAFEAVGRTDDQFDPGFFDVDRLALRMRQAGYTLAVARDLFIHNNNQAGIDTSSLPRGNRGWGDTKWNDNGSSRRLVVPPSPLPTTNSGAMQAARPTVSLTMIVRDEEANLPSCLASVEGLFDEIIVVDTGSVDRTLEVARSFGARVFDFPWVDDFSAARNAALARARGDYAFWLDAGDVIDPPERIKFQALFNRLGQKPGARVIRRVCGIDCGGHATVAVDKVRLFPVRGDVRWDYRANEQILPALLRAGVEVRRCDAIIRLAIDEDRGARLRKLKRNRRILDAELTDRPDDPFIAYNLGCIALDCDEHRAALAYLRRSLARANPSYALARKLCALIAEAHQALGEPEAALEACDVGLAMAPEDAGLKSLKVSLQGHQGEAGEPDFSGRRDGQIPGLAAGGGS